MLGKTVAVLALAASCLVMGVPPSLAGSKSTIAAATKAGWSETDSNGAHSRANPAEKVLTPVAVKRVTYLRSVTAPPTPPPAPCSSGYVAAPLPYGGFLYAITSGKLSKYNPATGRLIWRAKLNQETKYNTLAVSGNIVFVGGLDCISESTPTGIVYAINASTGARVWVSLPLGDEGPLNDMVTVRSYVITGGTNAAGYEFAVLNQSNGKQVWAGGDPCGNNPTSPALVVHLLVMSYGCDSHGNETIQARNLATGAVAWSRTGNWTLQRGDSGTTGKHLYATDPAGTVEDLNPLTGQVQHSLSRADQVLAVDTSRVYASCGSGGKYVCAYNLSTGALEWQDTHLAFDFPTLAAEADGVLYLNIGIAVNAATGKAITTIWGSITLGSQPATALAVGDGRIAVVTDPRIIDLYGLAGH